MVVCLPVVPVETLPLKLSEKTLSLSLCLQDWGKAGDVADLGVCWHVPNQEEENFVFQLLSRLLHPELQRIEAHVSGEQPMSRCVVTYLIFRGNQVHAHTNQRNLYPIINTKSD